MSEKAHLTSIEALDQIRTSLMIFAEHASLALNEVNEEVKRTRIWLQAEQLPLIAKMKRQRAKELDMLQQELYTARMSNLVSEKTGYQQRVNRKRKQIQELEDKMRAVKSWIRNFDSRVDPHSKKVGKLESVIDIDLRNAVNFLTQARRILNDYTDTKVEDNS